MKDHKLLYLIVFLLAALTLSYRVPAKDQIQPQFAAAAPLEVGAQSAASASPGNGPGYISIAPPAFRPEQDGYNFYSPGTHLSPQDNFSMAYYAPVYLPHGATVNRLTCYWKDSSPNFNGWCYLYRLPMNSLSGQTMANVSTSGSSGNVTDSSDTSITNPVVDNSQYSYYVYWYLPYEATGRVFAHSVLIEYAYETFLPLTTADYLEGAIFALKDAFFTRGQAS